MTATWKHHGARGIMDRRSFLKVPAVTALALPTASHATIAGEDPRLTVSVAIGRASGRETLRDRLVGDLTHRFVQRAHAALPGRFAVVASTPSPDILIGPPGAIGDHPALQSFEPDAVTPAGLVAHVSWLTIGGGQDLWNEAAHACGWHPVLIGATAPPGSPFRAIVAHVRLATWQRLALPTQICIAAIASECVQRTIAEAMALGIMMQPVARTEMVWTDDGVVASNGEAGGDPALASKRAWLSNVNRAGLV
jgi:hypothetical protein